jgi:hypothetical protein
MFRFATWTKRYKEKYWSTSRTYHQKLVLTQVNIRGVSSIGSGTGPLIVVDGQPMPDGFSALTMLDVASVEVLKMLLRLQFMDQEVLMVLF